MRKLLPLLLLLLASPARANIAFVACSNVCTNNAVASTVNIPGSGTNTFTAGNFLSVGIRAGSNDVITVNTPTDTLGNTFHCGTAVNSKTPSGTQVVWCYAQNITGGTDTITVTTNSSTNLHVAVDEYSGVVTSCNPTEGGQQSASASSQTAGSALTTTSVTTTGTDTLMAVGGSGANQTWVAGGSHTLRANTARAATEDRLNAVAGTYTSAITPNTTTSDAVIITNAVIQVCPAGGTAAAPSKRTKLERIDESRR